MLKDIPSDYDTKNPKYVSIDLNSGARIVVKATKYIELTEEFEKQIQSSYLVPDIQFEASEFVIEVVGDDKKKTTKSILNGVMIRKLGSFLKQE